MHFSAFLVLIISCLCLAEMDIVYLKDAAMNEGAVCLDGSPAIYYFRAGSEANSTKWVFHILGGGLCFNQEDCYQRSKMLLGTSTLWPAIMDWGGPISGNATYNPDFYDWNHAFFVYCDGACFSGDVEEPEVYKDTKLYYRGHRIILATIKDLLQNKGLDRATDVLVVGDSAGAMTTYYHIEEIRSFMPASVKRFKAVPFSGIFLDYPNVEGKTIWADNLKNVFNFQNMAGGMNQKCMMDHSPHEQYKCMFAEYTINYIDTPIMPFGSAYDFIGTRCILGAEPLDADKPSTSGAGNCSAVPGWQACEDNDTACTGMMWYNIEAYGDAFIKRIEGNPKLTRDGNGLFEYNCHTHDIECTSAWYTYSTNGVFIRDALRKWYFSNNEPFKNHFYKDCVNHGDYSCNPSCAIPVS